MHGNEQTDVDYIIDGDYAVFTTDRLSEFVFVIDNTGSLLWLIILLAVVLLVEIAFVVLKIKRDKDGKKTIKAYSFIPFLLACYIPVGQKITAAVLGALCAAGGLFIAFLYLLKNRGGKKKDGIASDEKSKADNPDKESE